MNIGEGRYNSQTQALQQYSKTEMEKGWKREPLYQQNTATPFICGRDLRQACFTEEGKQAWIHCSTEKLKSIWALEETAVLLECKNSLRAASI